MPQSTLPPTSSPYRRVAMLASAAVLLTALTLPSVWAQPATADGNGPGPRGARPEQMKERMKERMQARMQEQMQRLKEKLELSPEQEGAWNTFQEAMRPPTERPQRPNREELSRLSTPERIDRLHQLREQHASEANRRGEATKAFYAQLNPAQQKTFDAQSLRLLERMGPQQRGGGGRQGGQGGQGGGQGGPGMMRNM